MRQALFESWAEKRRLAKKAAMSTAWILAPRCHGRESEPGEWDTSSLVRNDII